MHDNPHESPSKPLKLCTGTVNVQFDGMIRFRGCLSHPPSSGAQLGTWVSADVEAMTAWIMRQLRAIANFNEKGTLASHSNKRSCLGVVVEVGQTLHKLEDVQHSMIGSGAMYLKRDPAICA